MSKLFRFSEFFGKSNGQILLIKGSKSPRKNKFVFWQILPYQQDLFVSVLLSPSVERCFVSCMRDFFFLCVTTSKSPSRIKCPKVLIEDKLSHSIVDLDIQNPKLKRTTNIAQKTLNQPLSVEKNLLCFFCYYILVIPTKIDER